MEGAAGDAGETAVHRMPKCSSRGALYIGRLYRRESRAPHSPAVSAARTVRSGFFPH